MWLKSHAFGQKDSIKWLLAGASDHFNTFRSDQRIFVLNLVEGQCIQEAEQAANGMNES